MRIRSKLRLAVTFAFISPVATALGQPAPSAEFEADIRKLMEISGTADLAAQLMDQMLVPLKQAVPDVPEEFWEAFMAKVDTDEVIALNVPIYAKYFTHEEVRQLLAFYSAPLGQKIIATMPLVMQESFAAGQQWGQRLGQQVVDELAAEGYQ